VDVRGVVVVLPLVLGLLGPPSGPSGGPAPRTPLAPVEDAWMWPVSGPVIRGFDPPEDPYSAGHRGIDIAAGVGTPIHAPASATVTFAGKVGGYLFLTLDHGSGLVSTYSWLSSLGVRKGDSVARGAVVAATGWGHPGSATPHLHLGVKLDGAYIDPLSVLGPPDLTGLIHLAPGPAPGGV
jgi:murein DD-endopeptidase MepM/ murein hydrolase activator NlpD